MSPDVTVEQCCALLLAHVLSLYSGRGDRGLAFGPKGKDLGFLLDGLGNLLHHLRIGAKCNAAL